MRLNEIAKVLMQHHYPEKQAIFTAQELTELSDSLQPLLLSWIEKDEETDYSVQGFTLMGLKNMFEMTYPAALLTTDWLIKDPIEAVKAITSGIK